MYRPAAPSSAVAFLAPLYETMARAAITAEHTPAAPSLAWLSTFFLQLGEPGDWESSGWRLLYAKAVRRPAAPSKRSSYLVRVRARDWGCGWDRAVATATPRSVRGI